MKLTNILKKPATYLPIVIAIYMLTLLIGLLSTNSIVNAAGARCFSYSNQPGGVPGYGEEDCNNMSTIVALNPDIPPFSPQGQDDKCFKFEIYASAYGAGVVSWAEEPCSTFENSDPPVCFKGINITYQGEQTHVYRDDYCDSDYKQDLGQEFEANKCYLIEYGGADNSSIEYKGVTTCDTLREAVAADANKQPDSPEPPGGGGGDSGNEGTGGTGGNGLTACGTSASYSEDAEIDCIDAERSDEYYAEACGDLRNRGADCPIIQRANQIIKVLSAVVGVVVTIAVIVGGIRYSAAGSDPHAVTAAKNMIRNAIIALVVYIFLVAFLNWVVPGGIV